MIVQGDEGSIPCVSNTPGTRTLGRVNRPIDLARGGSPPPPPLHLTVFIDSPRISFYIDFTFIVFFPRETLQ